MDAKTVVLDFDGVLFDSMRVKTDAFYNMFLSYGEPIAQKVLNHHLENGGVSRYTKLKKYFEEYLGFRLTEEELEAKAEEFSSLVVDKVVDSQWVPGSKDFLHGNRGKYDFHIVSGTPEEELNEIVKRKKIGHIFKEIYGSPFSKAENIRKIVTNNFYANEDVVYVGDSFADYEGALHAKTKFVGIGSFFTEHGLDVPCIPDLTELAATIESL